MPDLERSKTAHFDVPLLLERFLDRIEKCIDDTGAVFLGDERTGRAGYLLSNSLDEVGFGHLLASKRAVRSPDGTVELRLITR
jgi:hypothetical protein